MRSRKDRLRCWLFLVLLFLAGIYGSAMYIQNRRLQTRNAQCRGRLAQIAFALQRYRDEHGDFPPDAIKNEKGQSLLSWRVMLLPYMDAREGYKQFDLSEPWSSSKNMSAAERISPSISTQFQSPNDSDLVKGTTSFVVLRFPRRSETDEDHKIIVVEIHQSGIHWAEPDELTPVQIRARLAEMAANGESVHVLLADGQLGTITENALSFYESFDELLSRWMTTNK